MIDAVDNTIEERRKKRKTAEGLFAQAIKIRDNYTCRKCGNTFGPFETAHFITRGNKKIQFNWDNAFCLCLKCHKWAHSKRKEFKAWVIIQLGEDDYYSLIQLSNTFWSESVEFYNKTIKQLREFIARFKN